MESESHCEEIMKRRHELWMAEYGRVYEDEAEKARRFEIFKENVKYIEDFNNAGEHKYTLGVNAFTDLAPVEFTATYASGFKIPDAELEESLLSSPTSPSSVDQRTEVEVANDVNYEEKYERCQGEVSKDKKEEKEEKLN
ncbi:uncharacterized protein A4U43_C02F15690 [Asparagus officinalis]|uniref:Cathepsin propeptide inhibitor domain-containing protein n=1 Tax=Asparagus officinalis TaxID=4686 RepID=A0A5P1FNE7_ASPOF|nr:fruit bromelain-like [Asparagus officinalis]ONK78211.1 uncharacterized protein A4U43_C02F15690 [Asparagus officinalis]